MTDPLSDQNSTGETQRKFFNVCQSVPSEKRTKGKKTAGDGELRIYLYITCHIYVYTRVHLNGLERPLQLGSLGPLPPHYILGSPQENQSSVRRLHSVIAPQANGYTHSYLFSPLDFIDMQYKKTLVAATLVVSALSAYAPPEPWSTLTPPGTYPGGISNYPSTFGIAVRPTSAGVAKRDMVSQIRDGQVQAPRATETKPEAEAPRATEAPRPTTEVKPETEAKPTTEAPRATEASHPIAEETVPRVTEVPYTTEKPETLMPAISQIRDGQIQEPEKEAPRVTEVPVTAERPESILPAVTQIGDGQIQETDHTGALVEPARTAPAAETPATRRTLAAVSQHVDGQPQAHTDRAAAVTPVTQVHDGQPAAPAEKTEPTDREERTTSTTPVATHETTAVAAATHAASSDVVNAESCFASDTLQLHLEDGVLYDSHGRIGSIVANHQFQFDGPPPQAGAIYARGWSITPTGFLALGDSDLFYQCLSGDFYNLYDESIGAQCSPVHLEVVNLVNC